MKPIYIALGANLSNKKASFIKALELLRQRGVQCLAVSGLWQSPSWPPGQGHPDYLNAAAKVAFDGTALELLEHLQAVEAELGRERTVRNAPRPLDLDILDFRGVVMSGARLTLPHPRMLTRGFVLFPLAQIAPQWTDPVSGQSVEAFIARLPLGDVAPMAYCGALAPGFKTSGE